MGESSVPTTLRTPGAVLVVSCYGFGHQPLGLAWPMAFLERAGFAPRALDLALEPLDETVVQGARLTAIMAPMHTALRLGVPAARRIRRVNPDCRIVFCGLYAVLCAGFLLDGVADGVLGGEFEGELVALAQRLEAGQEPQPRGAALERLAFPLPSRASLPPLARYVRLARQDQLVPAGYVEASRGCLHTCLHCPIPPVYDGRFPAARRLSAAAAAAIRAAGAPGPARPGGICRSQSRVPAHLSALPHPAGVRRPFLRGASHRGSGGHPSAGRGRGRPYHLR